MSNLITTKNTSISVVSGESTKEFNNAIREHEKVVGNIVLGSTAKLTVLNIVLRELPELAGKHKWIRFDFGGKKRFELRRLD